MEHLRHPSDRPAVLADDSGFGVVDNLSGHVGRDGPLGRDRVLFALPLDPGPALLSGPEVVRDAGPAYLADAQNGLVGFAPVRVSRMLVAQPTGDTRRLG